MSDSERPVITGNDDGMAPGEVEMTFWDHLEVLRWTLMRVAVILLVAMIGCFVVIPKIFDSFILAPTRGDFFLYRLLDRLGMDSSAFHVDIININVASQFLTHMSTSLAFAAVITFPFLIFEIWKFLKPALFPNEQKHVGFAFVFGTVMFFAGCALGYCVVFPLTFRFLTQYQVSSEIVNQISLNSYMGTFLMLIFVMGLVFEMPLLVWLLSRIGIITKDFLKRYRRHAIVLLIVLAAIITPSGDPFTLSVVALPLYLLYELGILLAVNKKTATE